MTQEAPSPEVVQQQAGKVLSHVAGYVGARTIDIGLRHGLLEETNRHPDGISAEALAKATSLDPFYTCVWCRSAYAAEILEADDGETFRLAPAMDKLLLDQDFPGFAGVLPNVLLQPEMFDMFSENLPSGKRIWWDQCGPDFIEAVSLTARPFYMRYIPGGLAKVPGLAEKLGDGAKVLELACGTGTGLVRMAEQYPGTSYVGVDGDAHSLDLVRQRLAGAGLGERVSLKQSMLEELTFDGEFDLAHINVSMHECRDIDKVTQGVLRALKPDGYFVISDFPFPDSLEGTRTVPARIMCGIQFFEALIDDQLLPTQAYVELLGKHGFRNVGSFDMTPVHAVTYGQK
ncbi:MAG: class I SAM-dependent methyltransferase [Chloroflexi bacterium]|nr:class I SAM-dependent methyltransferase [Chloroflexota bacterium]